MSIKEQVGQWSQEVTAYFEARRYDHYQKKGRPVLATLDQLFSDPQNAESLFSHHNIGPYQIRVLTGFAPKKTGLFAIRQVVPKEPQAVGYKVLYEIQYDELGLDTIRVGTLSRGCQDDEMVGVSLRHSCGSKLDLRASIEPPHQYTPGFFGNWGVSSLLKEIQRGRYFLYSAAETATMAGRQSKKQTKQ